jgi:hypothetical protein
MGKVDVYREALKKIEDWDQYLLDESCLPGPRSNLELVEAVAEEGDFERFRRYLTYDADKAPYGSVLEFLPVCGVVGLGRLLSEGHLELIEVLRFHASDPRWRVREGVAIALQRFGETNMDGLLREMEKWSQGSLLEKRAVVAALCEPKLLKNTEVAHQVLIILDRITQNLINETDRKKEDFKVLRKTLGYGWSVAVVASPKEGKCLLEKWFANEDKDILWIMRENLKKNRLHRLAHDWTELWKSKLGVRNN